MFHLLRTKSHLQLVFSPKATNFSFSGLQFFHKSSISENPDANHSPPTISYLVDSCGLSPQSALSVAKKINFKITENADSVLDVFKSYGFTNAQIAKLVGRFPDLLLSRPEKTIRPKLDFLVSAAAVFGTKFTELVSSYPRLLMSSLEKRLKPNLDLLLPVLKSNPQLALALQNNFTCFTLLQYNLESSFLHNIATLKSCGAPYRSIARLVTRYPRTLMVKTEQFRNSIELIEKLGFNIHSPLFVDGVNAAAGLSTSTWKRKVEFFKTFGFSEDEVSSMFTKQPQYMLLSEDKFRRSMDFFVNKMNWEPSVLVANPVLLKLSLEKRVIPRCSVLNILVSKGLVAKSSSVQFLLIAEKKFSTEYVINFQDRVPEVVQAYQQRQSDV